MIAKCVTLTHETFLFKHARLSGSVFALGNRRFERVNCVYIYMRI